MAKAISIDRLNKLGARPLDQKSSDTQSPSPIAETVTVEKINQIVSEASLKAHAEALKMAQQQISMMEVFISKMPVNSNPLPPITGFKFNRGNDGIADSVTFLREKAH